MSNPGGISVPPLIPSEMTKEMSLMIQRFPSQKPKITELYLQDPEFRQLCDDYCLSLTMLAALRKRVHKDKQMELDYESVSEDLEREILVVFEKK